MNDQSSNRSSFTSLVVGVLLGALIPFAIQQYQDSVEQVRKARSERAQHIERMMTASTNFVGDELANFMAYTSLFATNHSDVPPDFRSLVPSLSSIAELRTISALYLPETEPEVTQVAKEYNDLLKDISGTLATDIQKMKTGAPPEGIMKAVRDGTLQFKSIDALQKKLIELAKQNQA